MLSVIITALFSGVFGLLGKSSDNATEVFKAGATAQTAITTTAMGHTVFWWAWGIAAVPMSAWFGLGMLGTSFPEWVPHVATIPPGLEPYAQAVWQNLFWTGGAVYVATQAVSVLGRIFGGR